jgi:mono/diheme cytochrome c family protein
MRPLLRFFSAVVVTLTVLQVARASDETPDFGRDVRPILAKHCFTCHGPDPDARESGLRLDQQDSATRDLGGYAAIKPGDPDASEIMVRVTSDDSDLRMPPSGAHPPLNDSQIATLRRWIESGGKYETHWSFVAPKQPQLPEVNDPSWCAGEIDRFILRRIEQAGLRPAGNADRKSLVRRLYLDLTGTTPTPEEVDRFIASDEPAAYRKLVDRLLATPEYAERFARPWLDLARYSDTNGYEKDRPRTIWAYRDWVIRALAADMPFDQFSIEQLAGDMLPAATNDQLIATGFHRNTMLNEEGGIDPLEYRFHALVDRVATTGTVWMGLTTGCAQCHTHKYDPITHTDYYSLLALLNNADEPDVIVQDAEREALTRQLHAQIRNIQQQLIRQHLPTMEAHLSGTAGNDSIATAFVTWFDQQVSQTRRWRFLRPDSIESTMPKLLVLDDDSVLASGDVTKRDVYRLRYALDSPQGKATALRLEALPHQSLPAGGPGMAFYEGRRGDFFLSELKVTLDGKPIALQNASHSFGKISVGSGSADAANVIDGEGSTGWSTSGEEGKANQWVVNFAEPFSTTGELQVEMLFERHFAAALGRFRISLTDGTGPVVASSLPQQLTNWQPDRDHAGVDATDYARLQRHFVRTSPVLKEQRKQIERLENSIPEVVRTLGMKQRLPQDYRVTHRHQRGEYLQPKEEVSAAVPALFKQLDDSQPANRLMLARWLVSEDNPLVGRVTANRAWREFFGTGIVDTAGDFGTQSEPPSHPSLLDWLAIDLRDGGWSLKRLHRQIVLSSTYRQAVGPPPPTDPVNRLLSRFPHRRVDAEVIRDSLLSAAGLLTRHVGGKSVHPPQPKSVTDMAYGSPAWNVSTGADRYRRSIYTFSKRTAPFASFATFDGPSGELCVARRDRSTTPLQALTLLNDQMYLEIARGLAETTLRASGAGSEPREIADRMFRRLLVRGPSPEELDAIIGFYESQQQHDEPWTLVARVLINTDEAITTP